AGADDRRHHHSRGRQRADRARRSLCRDQGTASRLLSRRLREPRRGDRFRKAPQGRRKLHLRDPPCADLREGHDRRAFGSNGMTDLAWIETALVGARPQAMSALLRYFRDLDRAEEAFQEACLRAMKTWPVKGPPRDPAAWLIFVGRNAELDSVRRDSRNTELPEDSAISDLGDAEADMAERLDDSHYRADILRLMFICCHPDLPATQQVALALRIVCGLTVREIAAAFPVNEKAMVQRITRATRRIMPADVPFGAPAAAERAERLAAVAAMIYLIFNEGYSASGGEEHVRAPLCVEAIRLARLLLRLFPAEPEVMGLLALMLLQHARMPARLDASGNIVLLE